MSRISSTQHGQRPNVPQPDMDTVLGPTSVVDQEVAAQYLGDLPARTLEAWRYRNTGPAYFRVGRHVRYRVEDLDSWLAAQRVPAGGGLSA